MPATALLLLLLDHRVDNAVGFRSADLTTGDRFAVLHRFERDLGAHWLAHVRLCVDHDRVRLLDG